MTRLGYLKSAVLTGVSTLVLTTGAFANDFNIPGGDLKTALDAYMKQARVALMYPDDELKGVHTKGAHGDLTASAALSRILSGTGFVTQQESGAIAVVREHKKTSEAAEPVTQLAENAVPAHAAASVETVVVTSSKIKGDIQTVPIAITALSQEQLTSRQIAGGPDLVKEVPNLTFTKTNFSGYSIQIRGIGTQAISVSTDPAVAVALNDIPFIRNHFFEQEFFDVNQVEVLRGPQGTLYGRNATAGVVNVITAKPTDQFEAMLSADWGNYSNRRYEGMVNIPIVDDRLDLRVAGEWTKRDGYTTNGITGNPVDGRDLWSSRVTLGWKPVENAQVYLVWEHFQESDDRMRTQKQLCKTDPGPSEVGGIAVIVPGNNVAYSPSHYLSQGCLPASLYSADSFGVPNGYSLPYYDALIEKNVPIPGGQFGPGFDPYASTTQSTNLRVIETQIDPHYRAKNDTLELNADYNVTPALTVTSSTGYNRDFLWSTEDYNRFNTAEGAFQYFPPRSPTCSGADGLNGGLNNLCTLTQNSQGYGVFCDPQLGCSDRLIAEDLSDEHSWQLSQEFRLASNFSGPLNFSVGGNYLHYETEENYYVFINSLTFASYVWAQGTTGSSMQTLPWQPGVSDNSNCIQGGLQYSNPYSSNDIGTGEGSHQCIYIDPNPINHLNNQGHNYFLSQNPYVLNSYAGFGEVYYKVTNDLKLTGGLRWTDDQKHFTLIPSEVLIHGYGYPSTGVVDQQWNQMTGRAVVDWTPKLDFTDQTLVYGSFAHGYKAGGANPPGALLPTFNAGDISNPIHPLTFKPEFIDAYELGTKNTMLDGGITLNGDVFFYNYTGYQISRIVDRTAINDNFNAAVKGAELEASYEPIPGLKFNFAGGYEDTRIDNGQSSIDLIDRTDSGNHPDWMLVKPFVSQTSNCILPAYVVAALVYEVNGVSGGDAQAVSRACDYAYNQHLDPVTGQPYAANPTGFGIKAGYPGFDPTTAPNKGEGWAKNLGGNELPNAPHFTTSLSAEYTMPVSEDWAATLHGDFYWQSQSFARVFNDRPYDKIRGYSTTNLALILTSASGWQVMGYVKNVFDATAITGDFLNSDDSGLTTNVFLTDPRLYGVRITKNW
jgi:iron complex outermembrane receptor protein